MNATTFESFKRDVQSVDVTVNKEDTRLIWLNSKLNDSQDLVDFQKRLLELNPAAQFYTDLTKCVILIKSIKNENILLLVSDTDARDIIPQVCGLRYVHAIFIFCQNRSYYVELIAQYSKVGEVFIDQETLVKAIYRRLIRIEKRLLVYSLFDQKQKSTRDLSTDSASFLWHQHLVHTLKKMPQDEHAKSDMLTKCFDYYALNESMLKKIEHFRKSYSRSEAIAWFTEEAFLYKLLNRAFRTEDIELLYAFRFYIIDLCTELERMHAKMRHDGVVMVYRGQQMSGGEFEKLRKCIGCLISTNGFLSTSRDMNVASLFAGQLFQHDGMVACLFVIRADPSVTSVVFANIEECSRMTDEQEVLFGLNATFKIESIELDTLLNVWKIHLKTTDEGILHFEEYIQTQEQLVARNSPTICFGRLLWNQLGQIDRAEKYFQLLLKSLSVDDIFLSDIYNELGNVYSEKGELNLALNNYKQAYEIRQNVLSSDHPKICASLHNLGFIYQEKGYYDEALNYYLKSLDIKEKIHKKPSEFHACTIKNIGNVYRQKGELDTALNWLHRALDIYIAALPSQHPNIALCLGYVGMIYEYKKDFERALDYYHRQLEMEEQCLPIEHPRLSLHLEKIAKTYQKKEGNGEKALEFCQQKLAAQNNILSKNHPRIASTLITLGDISVGNERREYYEQALVILQSLLPSDDLLNLTCFEKLAAVAHDEGNGLESIAQWAAILNTQRRIHHPDHPKIAYSLQCIGDVYFEILGNCLEACRYYEESLHIYRANFGPEHRYVIEIEAKLSKVQAQPS